jgi:hypothetical protein
MMRLKSLTMEDVMLIWYVSSKVGSKEQELIT